MVVVCLIFERMLRLCFSFFLYLSFIWILLFKMFFVVIYLLINGMPMIWGFISVIGKV